MAQLGFLYSICPPNEQVPRAPKSRALVCIESWMQVLAMFHAHCDGNARARFECLLTLNQELLNTITSADETGVLRDIGRIGECITLSRSTEAGPCP
jgi:hypothetical protein